MCTITFGLHNIPKNIGLDQQLENYEMMHHDAFSGASKMIKYFSLEEQVQVPFKAIKNIIQLMNRQVLNYYAKACK